MIHIALFRLRMAATSVLGERDRERGAGLVEYTLLIGLIVLVCIGAVALLGEATNEPYSEIGSRLGS